MSQDPGIANAFWKDANGASPGDEYRAATVCRRGHPTASNLTERPTADLGRCVDCGAKILATCGDCGLRIRGTSRASTVRPGSALTPGYRPPDFCDRCGAPHPWASRQARIYELENLLDEEDIDDADRLWVVEHLRQLQEPDKGDDPERERKLWAAVQRRAPGLFAGAGQKILETLIDVATRRALGMDGSSPAP